MVVEEPPWRKGRHREVVTALAGTAAAATTLELVAKSRDCTLMAAETCEWAEKFELLAGLVLFWAGSKWENFSGIRLIRAESENHLWMWFHFHLYSHL